MLLAFPASNTMTSQNSTLISPLSANHSILGQTGNGVSNIIVQTNQLHPSTMFANGLTINGTFLGGESLIYQHQQAKPPLISTVTNNQLIGETKSLPMNGAKVAILMDKLYCKSKQMKSWDDLCKSMKQSFLEKRPFVSDRDDKHQLQRVLDTLQNNIEVKSVQSMVERLETICRQLKLKFNYTKNYECFVSSDMYYVEIRLDPETGHVLDCNVVHSDASQSCPELIQILQKRNFIEFTQHLEGLSAIYQIDNDKKLKAKAYLALHSLENDLSKFFDLQKNSIMDINNMIHRSPVGILESRKGGYPMNTTFFVAPLDLIDLRTKSTLPLTVDNILERKIGYSAKICIEESNIQHKLQTEQLISVKVSEGKNLPQVAAHTASNSTLLPAVFVLKLAKPLPVCVDQARKISKITGIEFPNIATDSNLITLIAKQCFPGQNIPEHTSAFFSSLPDQSHCYYVNGSSDEIKGITLERVSFTHPSHVPQILVHLRQQVLFNVVISSIIRQMHEPDFKCHIFEIATTDLNNIYVQFEHPLEQSLATMDIDLKDITNVKCKLYPNILANICPENYPSKIMQKSLSISITMRSILNRTQDMVKKMKEAQQKDASSASAASMVHKPSGASSMASTPNSNSSVLQCELNENSGANLASEANTCTSSNKQPQSKYQQTYYNQNLGQLVGKPTSVNSPLLTPQQQQAIKSKNVSPSSASGNTMLMSMLSDVPHAAQPKSCKKRKRQSTNSVELITPSPKIFKQEHIDYDQSLIKLTSSDISSSGSISSDNDLPTDNSSSGFGNHVFYSIKQQGDDGQNEQLKLVKSHEEALHGGKESQSSSTEVPKLILKNLQEKSASIIKIAKSQSVKSTSSDVQFLEATTTGVRKDRKRKRTDSLEAKDSLSALLSGTSSGTSHLDLASPSSSKGLSVVSSSTTGKTISLATPPKLKKSNSTIGTSSSTTTSPVTSPSPQSIGKNLQFATTFKYNTLEKVGTITSVKAKHLGGGGSLSMLSSASKMMDFEAAAAAAVAASSGGSHAVAAAAAEAAVSNFDVKRFAKQVKAKPSGSSGVTTTTSPSVKSTNAMSGASSSSMSTISSSANPSATGRIKLVQAQSSLNLPTALKQKTFASAGASTATLPLSTLKQIQTSIASQPILQQSSTSSPVLAAVAVPPGSTLLSGGTQKGQSKPAKKGTLSAVLERLHKNSGGDGSISGLTSPGFGAISLSGQSSSSAEISSASSAAIRADSSSVKPTLPGSASKANSDKAKYSRNLDSQFTIKTQSNSGLKMSIAKTKLPQGPSLSASSTLSATELLSKMVYGGTGQFKSTTKYTIPKIPKSSQSVASLSASTVSITSGAITSPTLSSTTVGGTPPTVITSSPSSLKKSANVTKSANLSMSGSLPVGKLSPAPKTLQKGSAQKRSSEKAFKNPDLPPPGGFTKLGQILPTPAASRAANLASIFKQVPSNAFSGVSMTSSWPQSSGSTAQPEGVPSKASIISSSSDLYNPVVERGGGSVTSSSDVPTGSKSPHMPTSTPSSPVESPSTMGDAMVKPLIIPTEAIEDSSSSPCSLTGKYVDSSGELASRLVSADSSSAPSAPSSNLYVTLDTSESIDMGATTRKLAEPSGQMDSTRVFFPPTGKGAQGLGGDFYANSNTVAQTFESLSERGADLRSNLEAGTLIDSSDT